MEIYFDDNLIHEDYYTSLSTNFSLFSDIFYLGSVASNNYIISVAKEAVTTHPNAVLIKDNGILIATLVVDNIEENDFEYKYTLTDKMVNLEFNYDASKIFKNGSATLLEIAIDICNKAGIELATMNFRGYNKTISWYDNTRTAREYIGNIAELNGGYAQIGKDGRLYFIKQNTASVKSISIDDCEDFKIGEKHKISRVVYELGTLKYEYGDDTGNTLYLNGDNVYITNESEVEEIYNEIKDFEFYSFNTKNCPIDYNIMAGQVITFSDGTNNYPTIASYNLTYNGGWYGGYNCEIATKKQEETQVIGTSEKIKSLSIKVDRGTNTITQAVKEIDEQNQKIAQITQSVDEIKSQMSDIADITISADGYGNVSLANINESEPVYIRVRPTSGEDISYLYPRDNLFPSDDLFMPDRIIRFKSADYTVDYELPDNLLYWDENNYDEFILDYNAQTCVVNRKVGYNADGTKRLLDTPKTTEYPYPTIPIKNGDYTITLPGYKNPYIFVRMMVQNIYTDQFSTKAEVKSQISQTASSINLSVDQKLSNYSTTTQMNAAINLKSESITSTVGKTYSTKTETANAKKEAIDSSNASTDNKLKDYSTTVQMNSAIEQKADSITSSVSATYATKNQVTTLKTEIKQTTDSISSTVSKKVGYSEIISSINQSAEAVQINASKINLSGYLTVSSASNTYATKSGLSGGTTTINGNCITTGTIDASKVTVKNLNANNITSGTISASKINGGTITASAINLGNGKFAVTTAGALTATNATISGKITATSGTIGGWNVDSTCLSKSIGNYSFEIRSDRTASEPSLLVYDKNNNRYNFYVRPDGYLFARNANISGTINATSGSFSNCTITNCSINNGSGVEINAGQINASSISTMTIGVDHININNKTGYYSFDGEAGQTAYIPVPIALTVQDGKIVGQTWRRLVFKGGILVAVQSSW